MKKHVTVIITAWNQLEKTIACIETVIAQEYLKFNIILIDNGSDPPLAPFIVPRFPQVKIIRNTTNIGFARGCNRGLKRAIAEGADYFLLLNNDTVLAPDCLSELVYEASRKLDIGLVTAKIYYADDPNRIWSIGNQLHPWLLEIRGGGDNSIDRGQWDVPCNLEFATFCCVLLVRSAVAQVGLLDERYFLYYEDLDYCKRLRACDWCLRYAPNARVWHTVSASSGGSLGSPFNFFWKAQSAGRYYRKHGRGWRMLFIAPYRLASAGRTSLQLLGKRRWRALRAYWVGLYYGWRYGNADTPPPAWVIQPEKLASQENL